MNPFEKALELFGDDGSRWTKHTDVRLVRGDERAYCARGALKEACGIPLTDVSIRGDVYIGADVTRYVAATFALVAQVGDGRRSGDSAILAWNDRNDTTFEDVRLAFKHCAAEWEAE